MPRYAPVSWAPVGMPRECEQAHERSALLTSHPLPLEQLGPQSVSAKPALWRGATFWPTPAWWQQRPRCVGRASCKALATRRGLQWSA